MFGRQEIHEGMTVRARDGEKLGRIHAVEDNDFIVEKGLFFRKEYVVLFGDVMDVREDDVILRSGLDTLRTADSDRDMTTGAVGAASGREDEASLGATRATSTSAVNVPVVEEQLEVGKVEREAGAVRIKKDVVSETQTVEVPVRKEVLSVERVPVDPTQPVAAGTQAPTSAEVRVPLHEEEVVVSKRPVIKEEVRVQTHAVEEKRAVAEELKREEVSVSQEGDVDVREGSKKRSDRKRNR